MSDASSTAALLAEHSLSTYAEAFDERGWGSLTALQDISDGDLKQLIADVAMKSGHISRLRKALGKVPVTPAAAPPAVHQTEAQGVCLTLCLMQQLPSLRLLASLLAPPPAASLLLLLRWLQTNLCFSRSCTRS